MTDETFKPIPISQNRMVWADVANATGEARFKYDGEGFQPSFTGVIGPEGTMVLASIQYDDARGHMCTDTVNTSIFRLHL